MISREALKKDIQTEWLTTETKQTFFKIIDNAPTVTPTFGLFRALLCEDCQAYATNRAIARLVDEDTKPKAANRN